MTNMLQSSVLAVKAFFSLLYFDAAGLGQDFPKLRAKVRASQLSRRAPSAYTTALVCSAVNRACIWYPKRVFCLQRSMVVTCLLRSYGVPAQMVFGAQRLPFRAHAWVEVNGQVINERSEVQRLFAVWERC
jgi:hypothetical protein